MHSQIGREAGGRVGMIDNAVISLMGMEEMTSSNMLSVTVVVSCALKDQSLVVQVEGPS